jgi:hypothetical protein
MSLSEKPKKVFQFAGSVKDAQNMAVALNAMLSWLMVEQTDNEGFSVKAGEKDERSFQRSQLAKKGAAQAWSSAFNFLSHLNLLDAAHQCQRNPANQKTLGRAAGWERGFCSSQCPSWLIQLGLSPGRSIGSNQL